ncbi:TPA: hypothetical protein N0F65_004501, partial [Lagenidium giganteum]
HQRKHRLTKSSVLLHCASLDISWLIRNELYCSYMNKLVLEYLIGRGQRQLAEAFWRESATDRELEVDFSDVENRKEVQQHILTGNIARARQGIDQLDSLFLQEHREIDFVLAKQEVIELIKGHNIAEALSFAIKHLAPFGETSKKPQFLQEIEQAMALLAFETHACSPLAHLLEQPQRRRVADMVNSALLKRQKNHCGAYGWHRVMLQHLTKSPLLQIRGYRHSYAISDSCKLS